MKIARVLLAAIIALGLSLAGVATVAAVGPVAELTAADANATPDAVDLPASNCSSCATDAAMTPCVPLCVGFAAILPVATFMTRDRSSEEMSMRPARRLADSSSGPEPHPPKRAIHS